MLCNAKLIQHFCQDPTPPHPTLAIPILMDTLMNIGLEERQEPSMRYDMDEALLDYQSSAVGPLLLQTRYIILG